MNSETVVAGSTPSKQDKLRVELNDITKLETTEPDTPDEDTDEKAESFTGRRGTGVHSIAELAKIGDDSEIYTITENILKLIVVVDKLIDGKCVYSVIPEEVYKTYDGDTKIGDIHGAPRPVINVSKYDRVIMDISTKGHPLYITFSDIGGTGKLKDSLKLTTSPNVGIEEGILDFKVSELPQNRYIYYQCDRHQYMGNQIGIVPPFKFL